MQPVSATPIPGDPQRATERAKSAAAQASRSESRSGSEPSAGTQAAPTLPARSPDDGGVMLEPAPGFGASSTYERAVLAAISSPAPAKRKWFERRFPGSRLQWGARSDRERIPARRSGWKHARGLQAHNPGPSAASMRAPAALPAVRAGPLWATATPPITSVPPSSSQSVTDSPRKAAPIATASGGTR